MSTMLPVPVLLIQSPLVELLPNQGIRANENRAYLSVFLHVQFTLLNACFFALQTGQSSGASPSAVYPQTWQTQ